MKNAPPQSKKNSAQAWGTVLVFSALVMFVFAVLIFWTHTFTLNTLLLLGGIATVGGALIALGENLDA
jgi:fatty acid desaturase